MKLISLPITLAIALYFSVGVAHAVPNFLQLERFRDNFAHSTHVGEVPQGANRLSIRSLQKVGFSRAVGGIIEARLIHDVRNNDDEIYRDHRGLIGRYITAENIDAPVATRKQSRPRPALVTRRITLPGDTLFFDIFRKKRPDTLNVSLISDGKYPKTRRCDISCGHVTDIFNVQGQMERKILLIVPPIGSLINDYSHTFNIEPGPLLTEKSLSGHLHLSNARIFCPFGDPDCRYSNNYGSNSGPGRYPVWGWFLANNPFFNGVIAIAKCVFIFVGGSIAFLSMAGAYFWLTFVVSDEEPVQVDLQSPDCFQIERIGKGGGLLVAILFFLVSNFFIYLVTHYTLSWWG